MSSKTSVLVVGAGIAGATVAHRLGRLGFDVVVVERSAGQRSSGSPVDVAGPALPVVAAMGVLPRLRDAATVATGVAAVDHNGRRIGWMPVHRDGGIEIPRSHLSSILTAAGRDAAEFVYGDTVTALVEDGDGVEVTFAHAPARRFDLVVGADGLHSSVRRLAFGGGFERPTGLFVATANLGGRLDDGHTVLLRNAPNRLLSWHPGTGDGIAAFIFRRPEPIASIPDRLGQHALLDSIYTGMGWCTEELLQGAREADDMYFDSVSRIRLPRWSTGRIALVGDAASAVTLLGDGSSMAIAGAATLADSLAGDRRNPLAALQSYQHRHGRLVARRQRLVGAGAHFLVPSTRPGIAARNLALRMTALLARKPAMARSGAEKTDNLG